MDKKISFREKLIEKTKKEVKEFYLERDIHIIRAVSMLKALDETFNLLLENIKEWYGIYFPELERICKNNELYLKLLIELTLKENFSKKNLSKLVEEKLANEIIEKAKTSIGSEIKLEDLNQIKALAVKALSLREQRESLTNYIEVLMKEELPNFTKIATPLIGAQLLSLAGSKKKLALMPASTIQLLGAEKAFFAFLRSKKKPPKHGIIFNHPMIMQLKKEKKGKMARTLAAKLSLALKADFFDKKDISKELIQSLNKRLEELKK
jgi:nucleolar protein 56